MIREIKMYKIKLKAGNNIIVTIVRGIISTKVYIKCKLYIHNMKHMVYQTDLVAKVLRSSKCLRLN